MPATPAYGDAKAVEVGVKFTSDVAGYVTGLLFYKSSSNTGTHIGHLWSSSGTLLAAAVFTNKTSTGWQQVNFTTPVPISAHTTYVASYHTDVGYYAASVGYFSATGYDNGTLHAPASAAVGGNGVYAYGAGGFPTSSLNGTNYWVDVVFTTTRPADTLPPTIVSQSPAPGMSRLPVNTSNPTIGLSEAIQPGTIAFVLRDADNNIVPASVTYNPSTLSVALTPAVVLDASSKYTATFGAPKDLAGNPMAAPVSWSFTTGNRITTEYDSIPYFGGNPTIVSTRSGPWSSPSTWSGGRVPSTGDVVKIDRGTTVTYDVMSTAVLSSVTIQTGGVLTFRTDINTEVIAANYLVLPGGTLQIGTPAMPVSSNVTAQVAIADKPLNTAIDPEQYGDSLIGLGNVTIYGAPLSATFASLAVEPKAGDTKLTLAMPVVGWKAGDEIFLPDTRQLDWDRRGAYYVSQAEEPTIASISADGRTLALTAPLRSDHLGARDGNGVLNYLPQVADETRNVVIRSQNGLGTRGQVMFTGRANVDIRYAEFLSLGRTTINAIDNTTFDSSGRVTHIGTNEADRLPVQFRHLWGPTMPQADGYQFSFIGNVVDCNMIKQNHIWAIDINDSHYGLVQGNVVDNWSGAGIVTETGNETHNMIQGNFVARINGTGNRTYTGTDGLGYWFRGPDNSVVSNVATDINQAGAYSYGFDVNAQYLGTVLVPAFRGADPTLPGQSIAVNENAIPLRAFSGNQVYGATPNGLSLWWIGTIYRTPQGNAGTVKNFLGWHLHQWGYFGYETNNLTINGLVIRGDPSVVEGISKGMWFADYQQMGLTITNANIQGEGTGIVTPQVAAGATVIQNSFFRNAVDVIVATTNSVNGASGLPAKVTILKNDTFAATKGLPLAAISMLYTTNGFGTYGIGNLIQTDQVFVYSYNGVAGDDFQVYYTQQAPGFVVPVSANGLVGAPVSGLTNQQLWNAYHMAIAGAVAPTSETRAGIIGLVRPLNATVSSSAAIQQMASPHNLPVAAAGGFPGQPAQTATTSLMPLGVTETALPVAAIRIGSPRIAGRRTSATSAPSSGPQTATVRRVDGLRGLSELLPFPTWRSTLNSQGDRTLD